MGLKVILDCMSSLGFIRVCLKKQNKEKIHILKSLQNKQKVFNMGKKYIVIIKKPMSILEKCEWFLLQRNSEIASASKRARWVEALPAKSPGTLMAEENK